MTRLPRRHDDLGVIAVGEHRAATALGPADADRRIEMPGARDLEALHAPRERLRIARLDEQMDVTALEADLDDAEVVAACGGQRGELDRAIRAASPQAADRGHHAEHDMDRIPRCELRPRLVR